MKALNTSIEEFRSNISARDMISKLELHNDAVSAEGDNTPLLAGFYFSSIILKEYPPSMARAPHAHTTISY